MIWYYEKIIGCKTFSEITKPLICYGLDFEQVFGERFSSLEMISQATFSLLGNNNMRYMQRTKVNHDHTYWQHWPVD